MKSLEQVEERTRELYGDDLPKASGVLHVAAVWERPDGRLRVIRIGPGCPASETDTFVLRLARMRARAILTTGRILREEPGLSHREADPTFREWRRERAGLGEPPRTVVLTSGREVDLHHRALQTAHHPTIVTRESAAGSLRHAARVAGVAVEIVGRAEPGVRDALAWLRDQQCQPVLIEAGPTTAAALYELPLGVDELLLSVLHAPVMDERWVGPEFPPLTRLESLFEQQSEPVGVNEKNGRWTFRRFAGPTPEAR